MTVVAYLVCAIIWSTTWFAIRVCIGPAGYPTFVAAALRFVLATAVLGALVVGGVARPGPVRWRERLAIAVAGTLNAVGYALVYSAEERISGGLAAVLYGTLPLFIAAFAYLSRTEQASPAAIAGSLISLGGIGLIYADRVAVSAVQGLGVVMVLGSVGLCAAYNVILKRHTSSVVHPLGTTALFLGSTAVIMSALAFSSPASHLPWPPPPAPTIALLYLGLVGSVLAFATYFFLLKRVTLMTISTLVFIEPVLAMVIDARWEPDETVRLGPRAYAGAAVVLLGVGVSLLWKRRTAAVPATAG